MLFPAQYFMRHIALKPCKRKYSVLVAAGLLVFGMFGGSGVLNAQGTPPAGGGSPPAQNGSPPPATGANQPQGGATEPVRNQSPSTQSPIELVNPLGRGVTSIPQLFGRIVRAFMGILGALALFWFVWGGILWMTAEESDRSKQAQTIMKNAALGLMLLLFSYGLTNLFLSLFEEVARNATPARSTSAPATNSTPPAARR